MLVSLLTSSCHRLHLLEHLTQLQQVGRLSALGLGGVALVVQGGLLEAGPRRQPRPLNLLRGRGSYLLRGPGQSGQGALCVIPWTRERG